MRRADPLRRQKAALIPLSDDYKKSDQAAASFGLVCCSFCAAKVNCELMPTGATRAARKECLPCTKRYGLTCTEIKVRVTHGRPGPGLKSNERTRRNATDPEFTLIDVMQSLIYNTLPALRQHTHSTHFFGMASDAAHVSPDPFPNLGCRT